MQCLLIAATAAEIAPVTRFFRQNSGAGVIETVPDILVTGVGMMATAWQLSKYISVKKPGLMIQAGIAGCFDKTIPLTEVFTVRTEMLADLGVQEKDGWYDVFDMGFSRPSALPFSQKELRNPHKPLLKSLKLPQARGITVNTISSGKKQVQQRFAKYNPLLESMEGAAMHYVALQEGIPFIQLRSVSNYAGERNKQNWKIPAAIDTLNEELLRILKTI